MLTSVYALIKAVLLLLMLLLGKPLLEDWLMGPEFG
jgi:hypothetical protein